MYTLFVLLQGDKLVHHPWWTPQTTLSAALATASFVLLRSGLEILSLRSVVEYVQNVYAKLILRLTRGYTEMTWERFVECNRSEILHHTVHTAREASYCYHLSIELMATIAIVAAMLCAVIYQSPPAAVALILAGGVFRWVHRVFIREKLRDASVKKESTSRLLQRTLADLFSSGKELRTYSNHDFFYDRVAEQAHSVTGENVRLMLLPQMTRNMADQGVVLGFLGVVIAVELRHGDVHQMLALLVFYFVLSRRLLPLISQIAFMASQMAGSLESVWVVQEELSGCARFYAAQPEDELPRNGFVLELEDVSFAFGAGPEILSNVCLCQRTGEVVMIGGLSGSGKSSLLNIIAGVSTQRNGVIRIDHASIAYVPQEIALLDDTVRTNLLFGISRKTDEELMRALAAAELEDFISAQPMGLDTFVGDNGILFSGGQRQRLGLARAILRDPKLLLLDEATSALDLEAEARVLANLREYGTAVLLVTHRIHASYCGDRRLRLEDAQLFEDVPAQENKKTNLITMSV
jgi:ABC-type multidrug transport system fused ATPase/permease subunit